MKKDDTIEPEEADAEAIERRISMIDDYFAQQSPLAQMVEIKGAFLRLLRVYDELALEIIKMNRRTANTNSRLTQLEGRVRQMAEDLAYYDIQVETEKPHN